MWEEALVSSPLINATIIQKLSWIYTKADYKGSGESGEVKENINIYFYFVESNKLL